MPDEDEIPPRDKYGLRRRRDLRAAGVSRRAEQRKVDAGDWEIVHNTVVRHADVPEAFRERVMQATLAYQAVASHRAAAALYGIGGIPPHVIEISTMVTRRVPAGSDIVLHRPAALPDEDIANWLGIPLTTPARTIHDLGAVVDEAVVRRAGRDGIRKQLVTIPQMEAQLDRWGGPGKGGTTALRRVLETFDHEEFVLHSDLEAKLRAILATIRIKERYVWQPRVRLIDRSVVHPDLLFPRRRLVIEALGHEFHSARPDFDRDHRRWNAMLASGYRVLFFLAADAERPTNFVSCLERLLAPKSARRRE